MTGDKTRRVLSLSTLWPQAANPRGGIFVARSMEALQRRTHWQVVTIAPRARPPLPFGRRVADTGASERSASGAEVHRPSYSVLPRVGGRLAPGAILRAVLPLARRLHEETPFDLVAAQTFYPDGPAAARIAAELGLPLSAKARGADIHHWGARSYGREALLATAGRARGILAVSEALAEDMAALGIERRRIAVHYTGLDRDRFRPLDHPQLRTTLARELDLPLTNGEPLLLSVGALTERKGQDLVLRALPGLPEARLLLVGTGEEAGPLAKLAQGIGVADRVHFLGAVDHDLLPPLLSAADVMVLPSAAEGLANVWIESLACGTPLVVCDAGGAREVVTGPLAGRIVARSVRGVGEGIARVLACPRERQAVAATVARFSWDAHAAGLAAHYDGLL